MSEFEITSAAQDLADDVGIPLEKVDGTGKDGKITKSDVQDYIQTMIGDSPDISDETDVHTIVRGISKTGQVIQNAYFPSDHVDAYVSSWLREGYELREAHYLGDTDQGFRMMYVLVRP